MNNVNRVFRTTTLLVCLVIFATLVTGCASTGRGEFPRFDRKTSGKTLAILPPLGYGSNDLRNDIVTRIPMNSLSKRFKEVTIVSQKHIRDILGENFSGERLTIEEGRDIAKKTGADMVLAFWIHDYVIERFSTKETQTLYGSSSRQGSASIDRSGKENRDVFIYRHGTRTSSHEIPVNERNNRVVLSMSVLLYDLQTDRVIWRGKRVEKAQDQVEDASAVELKDIVIDRVMVRLKKSLSP